MNTLYKWMLFACLLGMTTSCRPGAARKDIRQARFALIVFPADSVSLEVQDSLSLKTLLSLGKALPSAPQCGIDGQVRFFSESDSLGAYDFNLDAECANLVLWQEGKAQTFAPPPELMNLLSGRRPPLKKHEMFSALMGTWISPAKRKERMVEIWMRSPDGSCTGKAGTTGPSADTAWYETSRIFPQGKQHVFEVTQTGQSSEQFQAREILEGAAIEFTRESEDWPQSILYNFITPDSIRVDLTGMNKGKLKVESVSYSRFAR